MSLWSGMLVVRSWYMPSHTHDTTGLVSPLQGQTRLDMLTREIVERKGQVGRGLYEIGIRLAHIADDALWRAGAHASFEDYLASEVQFSRSTAYRLIRIARAFDARIVARHGIEKLDLAVRYLRAARLPPSSQAMHTPLRIRDPGGRYVKRTLDAATSEEIQTALNELRQRPQPARISNELRAHMRQLEARLPPAPQGTHRGQRIRLRRGDDGHIAVSFHAIPLDHLDAFIAALSRATP
jgi:hypothetical protein